MADEGRITSMMEFIQGNLNVRTHPNTFQIDVAGNKGPVPGALTIPTSGENLNFGELTTPGYAIIRNLDATNFVTLGNYVSSVFYPVIEILPGEHYILRWSRSIGTIRMQADTADVKVSVESYET